MTDRLRTVLDVNDVDGGRVHRELFFAPESSPFAAKQEDVQMDKNSTVKLIHNDGTLTFDWDSKHEVILNQALELKDDLPYACQVGVCGTCRAKVIEGEVSMIENMALDQSEIDQGYVLTCQAHPKSKNVVLRCDD